MTLPSFFFFQAEDGIRDYKVTGVQTCALPISHSPGDGLWIGLHYGRYSPVGFVERPEPNFASINLDAGASTQGSYALVVDAQAPAWWAGWRAGLTFGAVRVNRLGYYGLGNDTQYSRDSLTTAGCYFYKVIRTTQFARAKIGRASCRERV